MLCIVPHVQVYVVVNDKARDGAAILCARLVTRPDLQTALLPEFFTWAKEVLCVRVRVGVAEWL